MTADFFLDLFNRIIADATLSSIWTPYQVRARYKRADQNDPFPYLVYDAKFKGDHNESGDALGTGFLTIDVYDKQDNSARALAITTGLKRLLNRSRMDHSGVYHVTRLWIVSHANIPDLREDVTREELIFQFRYYDETVAELLY